MRNWPRAFSAIFIMVVIFAPTISMGWALSSYVEGDRAKGYLLTNILAGEEIKYALKIEDKRRFSPESLQIQIETALRLWMHPFNQAGFPSPKITRVDAKAKDLNLLVELAKGRSDQTADMNVFFSKSSDRPFSKITIRTNYLVPSEFNARRIFRLRDFRSFLSSKQALERQLREVSADTGGDVFTFSQRARSDWRAVWNSTYPTIVHELGHAFGLADTCKGQLEIQSLPEDRSLVQPDSIMKSSNHFALQSDDLEGIRAVIKKHARLRNQGEYPLR